MIIKTEDLIKKVMLKAQQLTETSEEKIYEKIYRMNMQDIKIISLFYSRLQTFLKSAKRPVLLAYILGSKKLKREVRTCE